MAYTNLLNAFKNLILSNLKKNIRKTKKQGIAGR